MESGNDDFFAIFWNAIKEMIFIFLNVGKEMGAIILKEMWNALVMMFRGIKKGV